MCDSRLILGFIEVHSGPRRRIAARLGTMITPNSGFVLALTLVAVPVYAQWSLPGVVRSAGQRYPGVEISLAKMAEAAAGVQLARTSYLPKADYLFHVNRATRNNVFGMMMPQQVVAPISGPPLATNAGTNVWGTATGFLVSWEPFDLGQRKARDQVAGAERLLAEKALVRTRFQAEAAAADAFLTILAADEVVRNGQAGSKRAESLVRLVEALAAQGLRPGTDLARARIEKSAADAQWIQARTAARTARAAMLDFLGDEAENMVLDAASFSSAPWQMDSAAGIHPLLAEQQASLGLGQARRAELDKAWMPKFLGQSALYARGTGAYGDGSTGGAFAGLGPNIYNWGVGFSVQFALGDLPAIRARRQAETARLQSETARLQLVQRNVSAEVMRARARLDGAREMVAAVRVQYSAATEVYEQAQARYSSGLAGLIEVVDAQRTYQQAEIDDALARLAVWRAQLGVAIAAGDLVPFLNLLEKR
ncbi:MAG: TolC family protein [Candidatus Solibacter sp.]|nr:TolC family protein [Candidatus Solibacter sp.]